MLAIRLQRTGRRGHSQFRVIVQDARLSPKSGKVVVQLGSYNPHTKAVILDAEKAKFYLDHGAQPSDRVIGILKQENVKLPKWVKKPITKKGKTRNPDKYGDSQSAASAEKPDNVETADAPVESVETPEVSEIPEASEPVVETADKDNQSETTDNENTA
ncbi:MAG TPA: 30S ribosomal protein S16 [Candidatus Saccharimonadales bacterium]|nr:30S ribosomal protein S16 [Candidatus Saccharimonadales bacterium]